ncbi:hypothetical protein KKF84_18035 [Myxococcota bacterium]|nr:hypothetical protein [Myxococcota bacterium]MBU1537222.1 hypothetical protein [Myxococcota bacterium]
MKSIILVAFFTLISCTTKTVKLDPYCGDGSKNLEAEQCDGLDTGLASCESLGYYGGLLKCNTDCTFNELLCAANGRCGDGVLHDAEECDDDAFPEGETSCEDLGFTGGQLQCTEECLIDSRQCATCGDGIFDADGNEECDGNDFGETSCVTLGFWGGRLSCDTLCQINHSQCKNLQGVSAGYFFTCALTDTGEIYCMGANTLSGRLGIGSSEPVVTPTSTMVTDAVALSIGWDNGCYLNADGDAFCWGDNRYGQVGDNTETDRLSPAAVTHSGTGFASISSGYGFSCAVDLEGTGYCWGAALDGRLGNNVTGLATFSVPQAVETTNLQGTLTRIAAGKQHACALDVNGQAYCWGNNLGGKCGTGAAAANYTIPTPVSTTRVFTDICAGGNHSCTLDTLGAPWCWGDNSVGQLGNLATEGGVARDPVAVNGVNNVVFTSIACAQTFESTLAYPSHTCALDSSGHIWCWGSGALGQLGNGATPDYSVVPVQVTRPVGVTFTSVTAGRDHTCAGDDSGQVWCWGSNEQHQINDSTQAQFVEPVLIPSAL